MAEEVKTQWHPAFCSAMKWFGDSILQVAMKENQDVFNKMKEEGEIMCQALREFFADELNEALEKRTIQVTEQNKKDIISNGLKKGFDVKLICELVGVSAELVEAVKQEMLEAV